MPKLEIDDAAEREEPETPCWSIGFAGEATDTLYRHLDLLVGRIVQITLERKKGSVSGLLVKPRDGGLVIRCWREEDSDASGPELHVPLAEIKSLYVY